MPRAAGARRICLVRHGFYPSDPLVRRVAEALVDRGHEVDLVCLRGGGQRRDERVGGVRVHRLPIGHRRAGVVRYLAEYAAFAALAAVRLTGLDARRRFDVIQVHTMPDFLVFVAVVPKLRGARVLLYLHEVMPELFRTKFGTSRLRLLVPPIAFVERAAARFADAVVAVSEPARYVLLRRRAVPDEKLTVVMNAADERLFSPDRVRPRTPVEGRPLLVSHGTLVPHYGFQTSIRAMALLRELVPGARLVIAGEGEYEGNLRRLTAHLGVDDRVAFLGQVPIDEIPPLLAAADIGVVTYEVDDFTDLIVPTKLMELVAMHVPAVVVRSSAVLEHFDPEGIRLFDSGDEVGLARAVEELAADPERARAMADRAAETFLPRYGWAVMKERYLGLVDEVAAAARRRRSPAG